MSAEGGGCSEVYYDRNLLAQAFARMAAVRGWKVGIGTDAEEPDWPVLFVDTPSGQVSWHLEKGDVVGRWPEFGAGWDGHTTQDKREMLCALIYELGAETVGEEPLEDAV